MDQSAIDQLRQQVQQQNVPVQAESVSPKKRNTITQIIPLRYILWGVGPMILLLFAGIIFLVLAQRDLQNRTGTNDFNGEEIALPPLPLNSGSGTVSGSLVINLLTEYQKGIQVTGTATFDEITASNVLYDLSVGAGLASTGGQQPTLTNTGVLSFAGQTGAVSLVAGTGIEIDGLTISSTVSEGSDQNLFSKVALGSSSFSAGSTTDTITFASGDGISLSMDETAKKITISNSSSTEPLVSADGTGSTSSFSGMELAGTGSDELALLQGCADGELLKWDEASSIWECGSDVGGLSSAVVNVKEGGTLLTSSADTLDFSGTDFSLTESPSGEVNIVIDYASSLITRSDQDEVISGSWEFGAIDVTSGLTVSGGNVNLATGNTYQINGTTVLNANTLGTGITSSSLTSVGALASGSIASGFGTIATANTITGTTINGTTGINTGAGAGTIRINSSGNLINIGTTQFNNVTYTWPGADATSSGYVLTSNSSGTLSWQEVTGIGGVGDITAIGDVSSGAGFTTGGSGSSLYFHDSTFEGELTIATLTGDHSYTLPNSSGTICVSSGNCAGTGAGIGGSGTTNFIPKFSAQYSLTDSSIFDNGNVGIGTSSPLAKLDVNGTASLSSNLIFSGARTITATALNPLTFGDSNTGALLFSPGGTNRVTFTPGGNVGIGTTNPTQTLHVNGRIRTDEGMLFNEGSASTDNLIYVGSNSTEAVDASFGFFVAGVGSTNADYGAYLLGRGNLFSATANQRGNLYLTAGNPVSVQTGEGQINFSTGSDQIRMVIDKDGNIGIGNTAPGYKLAVSGTANITGAVTLDSTISLGGQAYDWSGATVSNGYILQTNGSGALSWVDPGSLPSSNYWRISDGAISPFNDTLDVLFGASASTSAKFAFLNMNGGSPTASISGNLSLVTPTGSNPAATFNMLNGGSLNFQSSAGGDAGLASRLFVENAGSIGIGNTTPNVTNGLSVAGTLLNVKTAGISRIAIEGTQSDIFLTDSGASADQKMLMIRNDGGFTGFVPMTDAGGGVIGSSINIQHSNGNVGIGQSTAQETVNAKLEVGSYGAPTLLTSPAALFATNTNNISGIEMKNLSTGGSADFRFAIFDTAGDYLAFAQPGTGNSSNLFGIARNTGSFLFASGRHLGLGTIDNDAIIFGTNNTERMRITGANVGIGITNPAGKLVVAGSANTEQLIVRANGTQTNVNPLFQLQNSSGTELLSLTSDNTSNVFLGYQAGIDNNPNGGGNGLYNTFLGSLAGTNNATGSANTAIGYESLTTNTIGLHNTAVGYGTLRANTIGGHNSALGLFALGSNTTGLSNSALGRSALVFNTTGNYNSVLGNSAGQSNTTGSNNTLIGASAGLYNQTGFSNTIMGYEAGLGVTLNSYSNNTLLGYRSGYGLTTGSNNLLLGYQSGDNITSGANNIIIGYDIDAVSATGSNQLNIGNVIFGDLSTGNIGIGDTTPTSALLSLRGNAIHIDLHDTFGAGASIRESNDNLTFIAGSGSVLARVGTPAGSGFAVQTSGGTTRMITQNDGITEFGVNSTATIDSDSLGFLVHGSNTGKALFGLNELGDQNIFVASSSGTTQFIISNSGDISLSGGDITGANSKVIDIGEADSAGFTFNGHLFPSADDTYDLGSNSNRWRDLYLGPTTLHIGTSTSDEYTISYDTTDNYLGFNVNGSGNSEIVFASNGNVGIGVTNPSQALDVAGSINISGTLYSDTGLTSFGAQSYDWSGATASNGYILTTDASGVLSWIDPGTLPSSNYFQTANGAIAPLNISSDLLIGASATSSATIRLPGLTNEHAWFNLGTGNVGIGNTSPTNAKLDVTGTGYFSGALTLASELNIAGLSSSASTTEGAVYYDTDDDQLKVYANGRWQADRSTATLIVAASDTRNKEKADYVADGTNDEVEIEAAITAIPANGGTVVLLEGTYSIGSILDVDRSNITITGSGKGTKLVRAYNESTNANGLIEVGNSSSIVRNNITIQNIEIDGQKSTYTNAFNHGIVLDHRVNNSRFLNNHIHDTAGHGIYLYSVSASIYPSEYNRFDGNEVKDNGLRGIYLYIGGNKNTVTNNIVSGNGDAGISIGDSDFNTVSNNTITSNTEEGILVEGGTSNTFTANTIQTNGKEGVYTINAVDNTISNNTITGNGTSGTYDGIKLGTNTANTVVSNNTITGNTNHGILLASADYSAISGNSIADNTKNGILVDVSAESNQITGNVVFNNTESGIEVYNADFNNISGNNIRNNGFYGIFLRTGPDYNTISTNRIHNNGGSSNYDGIRVYWQATNNQIINNHITDTAGTGYAINVYNGVGTSDNNYVAGNTYSGTGASTLNLTASNIQIQGQRDGSDFRVNSSMYLDDITAPGTTTNRLYADGGDLYWNGTQISGATNSWTSNGSDISFTTGNVGIGTATPAAKLDLTGTSDSVQSIIRAYSSQTVNLSEWYNSAGNVTASLNNEGALTLGSNVGAVTSYSNSGGQGDRSSSITVSTNLTISGSISALVNGNTSESTMFFSINSLDSSDHITFDFGSGSSKVITEARFIQSDSTSQGTWKWQGSNNSSSWDDIGGTFTLGGSASQTITTLSSNTVGYRYYRIAGVSGSTSSTPWIREMEFKIVDAGNSTYSLFSGDKVGIGTSDPTFRLDVTGSIAGKALVSFNETGDQDIFTASSSGITRFVINNEGNIGIGEADPFYKLSISETDDGNAPTMLSLYNPSTDAGSGAAINLSSGGGACGWQVVGTDALMSLGCSSFPTKAININTDGNVGIGTTTPGSVFSISGLTTGGTTPLLVDASGNVFKDSSSARYKDNITSLNADFSKILDLDPKSYTLKSTGESDIGFLAEDLDGMGLTDLVIYDSLGRPDGIKYSRFPTYLVGLLKEQNNELLGIKDTISGSDTNANQFQASLDELKQSLEQEKSTVNELHERIEAIEGLELINLSRLGSATESAVIGDNLLVLGTTTLREASITETLAVGTTMQISPSSINTLELPLEIQPMKQAPISIMADAIRIETDGTVHFAENVAFAKDVDVKGEFTAQSISVPKADITIQSDTVSYASTSAGTTFIKAGQTQRTVIVPQLKADSLVYITPLSDTQGLTPYVSEQKEATGTQSAAFTVKLPSTISHDMPFNFFIINQKEQVSSLDP